MRKAFSVLFTLGTLSAIYFVLGHTMHWQGNHAALCVMGACYCSGIMIRVMEV